MFWLMADAKEKTQTERNSIKVPYVNATTRLTAALEKIQSASTPDRFTQDFLSTKLGLKGGSAYPVIPFFKKTGFINSDGTPTEIYKQFRNENVRGYAAAQALKKGYAALYEINEYAHELDDKGLKSLVMQATGLEAESKTISAITGSFKAIKKYADFEKTSDDVDSAQQKDDSSGTSAETRQIKGKVGDIKLGYTINLNLPATSDIAVFNAIFKSLREHLLDS
jgi:hypothetical protein